MLLRHNLEFRSQLEFFLVDLQYPLENLWDSAISFSDSWLQESFNLLIPLAYTDSSGEKPHMRVFGHMVSFGNQLFDNQLVIVIWELNCVDDMDILVKLRLRVDHRQIGDHVVVLNSVLLQELVLSFQHLLYMLVVEQNFWRAHRLFQSLVQLQMPFDYQRCGLNVMNPLRELLNNFLEVLMFLSLDQRNSNDIWFSSARDRQEKDQRLAKPVLS